MLFFLPIFENTFAISICSFGVGGRKLGVIVINQNCLYLSSSDKWNIRGCGFLVQKAKQSTTFGDKLYLVT